MNLAKTPAMPAASQVKAAETWDPVPRKACWEKSQMQLSLCERLRIRTKSRKPKKQLEKSDGPREQHLCWSLVGSEIKSGQPWPDMKLTCSCAKPRVMDSTA